MALDPRFITAPSLQEYFVDKDTGEPLAGGKVYFYSDVNRIEYKDVFELTGAPPNYSFSPLPNPVILSSVGTMMDNNGNDIIPYYFPFDAEGNQELYYIVVQSSTGVPQFTRQAWPNPQTGETPESQNNLFNYIPNGQFLLHTDLPNNELAAGSNIIAQGGWSIELPNDLNSENFLNFIPINFTENPSNSPRFTAQLTAGAAGLDTIKALRIKWNDVNKFSATQDFFTYAFWARSDINVPISINLIKYCGTDGTVVPSQELFTDVITPEGKMYVYSFQFPSNSGLVIDTVNNDDYVALDISFPVNISFVVNITDAALVDGDINLQEFPLQTNADMVTRGNDGWTDVPAYNGYDLYLPKVQTRYGYTYDRSSIGKIESTIRSIPSPLSLSPLPTSNDMLLDGATYIYTDYSVLGIPFARLGDVLISESSVANTPLFGTGTNFATAYLNHGSSSTLRLTVNGMGTGVGYAQDGIIPTGFTFEGIPDYDGSVVGSAFFNWQAFSSGATSNTIICKASYSLETPLGSQVYMADVDTGFTFVTPSFYTGIYAEQTISCIVTTVAASALSPGSGMDGLSFRFFTLTDSSAGFYIWFNVSGEIDPGPPGSYPFLAPIEVKLNLSDTAQDVANTVKEVMSALQSTNITIGAAPDPGSYFTFQTNPSAVRNFYIWYSDETGGTNPGVPGSIGINVLIGSGDSTAVILTKTLVAINKYQYAVPAAQGMFLRNADPNGDWDFDYLTRWSNVTGLTGPNIGTFEFSQLLNHLHLVTRVVAGDAIGSSSAFAENDPSYTETTGGSETRPVNMYVNYYIKY